MMAINSKIMEATADDGLAGLLVSVRALDCGGTSVTFVALCSSFQTNWLQGTFRQELSKLSVQKRVAPTD